jgi:hypothetical protein
VTNTKKSLEAENMGGKKTPKPMRGRQSWSGPFRTKMKPSRKIMEKNPDELDGDLAPRQECVD